MRLEDKSHRFFLGLLICLQPAAALAQAASASEIRDYATLKQTVLNGQTVAFVTDLTKCKMPSGEPGPKAFGVATFNSFYVTERSIAASETLLYEAPGGRMLLKNLQLQISPDNRAELVARRLVPTTYELVGAQSKYECRLGDGSVTAHARP